MTTSNETKLKQELEALKKQLQEAKDPSQSPDFDTGTP